MCEFKFTIIMFMFRDYCKRLFDVLNHIQTFVYAGKPDKHAK